MGCHIRFAAFVRHLSVALATSCSGSIGQRFKLCLCASPIFEICYMLVIRNLLLLQILAMASVITYQSLHQPYILYTHPSQSSRGRRRTIIMQGQIIKFHLPKIILRGPKFTIHCNHKLFNIRSLILSSIQLAPMFLDIILPLCRGCRASPMRRTFCILENVGV